MYDKSTPIFLILCLSVLSFFPGSVHAAAYSVSSVSSQTAVIAVTIDSTECTELSSSLEYALVFAITSAPSMAPQGRISMCCDAEATLTPLSQGWSANRFLQWFRITLTQPTPVKNRAAKLSGTITFTFDSPLINTNSFKQPYRCGNCIIDLPLMKMDRRISRFFKPPAPYTTGVRMEIPVDALYKIGVSDLIKCGVPIDKIPSKTYRLFCKDTEIPIYITNPHHTKLESDDIILFYGKHLRGEKHYYSQYSNVNVYWLTWGGSFAGARVAETSGEIKIDPGNFNPDISIIAREFIDTAHLEQDVEMRWLGTVSAVEETNDAPLIEDEIDNWFWAVAGQKKLTTVYFTVASPVKNSSFDLQFNFTGLTSINSNPADHNYLITINDKAINTQAIWDGYNDYTLSVGNVPSQILTHGQNNLTLILNQTDTIPDRVALNWFKIIYNRGFEALNDIALLRSSPKDVKKWVQYDVTGFTSDKLDVWDISNYRIFRHFIAQPNGSKWTVSFQDSIITAQRYLVQTQFSRLTPLEMVLDTISNPGDFADDIDYIMISRKDLLPFLKPLVQAHTERGLKVAAIDIMDIYNYFSYGLHDPESIRSLLRHIFSAHPLSPPRYLLLGGDCTHDLDKNNRPQNVVPTHLSRVPNWGPSSNDDYFATVEGDDNFVDMYVGRFPARDGKDMQTMVGKTVAYLQSPEHGYWKDNIILAGGYESEFTSFNNEITTGIIGPKMNIFRMDADPKSPFYLSGIAATNKLSGFINSGAYVLNFAGHGGGLTWSDSKFFSYSDLDKLHNSQWSGSGRLPIIFSFTCLTGFFESVLYKSLGEEFLRQSANGCISFYGASAYTRRNIDIRLARAMLNKGIEGSYASLGELINTTEMLLLAMNASEAIPLTRQYNLLGDPAIPWQLTPDTLAVTLSKTNLKGADTLTVLSNTRPIRAGKIKLSVTADNTDAWGDIIIPFSDTTVSYAFPLKAAAKTAHGLVRAFAWNDSTELKGWVRFSKDTFALYDAAIEPAAPALGDSVTISCRIDMYDSTVEPVIQCRYTIDNPQQQNISFTSAVFMKKDTISGLWYSSNKIAVGSSAMSFDITQHLICRFFASGTPGVSDFFYFKLRGRPDLVFTADTLTCSWHNDSLYAVCEVLNGGNGTAALFPVVFYNPTRQDTVFQGFSFSPLPPGKTVRFSFSIADTQGLFMYTGRLNPGNSVEEICYENNATKLLIDVRYADMQSNLDTLSSHGMGCRIVPQNILSTPHRFFLFSRPVPELKPLQSASNWIPLVNDGVARYTLNARPALSGTDSLVWLFYPSDGSLISTLVTDSGVKTGIFDFDSSLAQWINLGGVINPSANAITLATNQQGDFAAGAIKDNTPPEIRVFVAGKEILFLDYAAQNKPFNIFITDSSGIMESSIQVLLNGSNLTTEAQSNSVEGENRSVIILTAYPQKISGIDSLTIIAIDKAGNRAEKGFTYRPGEKLKIKFFSCHPNPFTAKSGKLIRFPFLLTDIATRVNLTIYTISGRKVWTWKSSTEMIGYQEIVWDGTTLNRSAENMGYRIANGTYYAKLVAKNKQRTVEKIIRIAKLEGY